MCIRDRNNNNNNNNNNKNNNNNNNANVNNPNANNTDDNAGNNDANADNGNNADNGKDVYKRQTHRSTNNRKEGKAMEFEKLTQIIVEVLNVDENEITMDTTFIDDLGADSLDVFQIIMGLEEEFDIEIPNEQAEKIVTVADAVEQIKSALNNN